jgi:hypothetical protein
MSWVEKPMTLTISGIFYTEKARQKEAQFCGYHTPIFQWLRDLNSHGKRFLLISDKNGI